MNTWVKLLAATIVAFGASTVVLANVVSEGHCREAKIALGCYSEFYQEGLRRGTRCVCSAAQGIEAEARYDAGLGPRCERLRRTVETAKRNATELAADQCRDTEAVRLDDWQISCRYFINRHSAGVDYRHAVVARARFRCNGPLW